MIHLSRRALAAGLALAIVTTVPAAQAQRGAFSTDLPRVPGVVAQHGMVVAQETARRPDRRRGPQARRQRGRRRGRRRLRDGRHLSARRQHRRRRLHGDPPRRPQAADSRSTIARPAPAATTRDTYLDAKGEADPKKSRDLGTAIGVPGTVAGLALAHQKYGSGKFTLAQLIAPAIVMAPRRHSGRRRHRRLAALRSREAGALAGIREDFPAPRRQRAAARRPVRADRSGAHAARDRAQRSARLLRRRHRRSASPPPCRTPAD